MNFKSWLISEEEEKDINLSNPNLTATIPLLNTSLSNPNLTINIPPLNANQKRTPKNSSDRFKELAIYYGRNKSAPSTFESIPENKSLGVWLNGKKIRTPNPHEKSDKTWAEIVSEFPKWIDPDTKQPFKYPNLPISWRDVKSTNAWQKYLQKNQKNSSDRFKELAIYYGRKRAGPSQYGTNPELGIWLSQNKIKNPNSHEEYDKTWAEIVSEFPKWIDPDTKQPFKYPNLPINWRKIKPNVQQEEGRITSSKRLEELAYYYGENGASPSQYTSDKKDKSLALWHVNKKRRNPNPYEESDKETWNRMVELSKTWDKKKFPYDLPNDWREIKPSGEKSLGEKLVANILKELEIENDPQHRDEACKNKMCLPFDFSITHNGKKYLEFHGEQHYYPVYFGSGEGMTKQIIAKHALDKFEYTQGNDTIKYEHCVRENIPFLVIPYWLYETPDIIKNTIIEFLNTNQFDKKFADPVVPPKYKVKHDKKYAKYLAKSNPTELVYPTKTFEQFLINKNFINI